MPQPIACSIRHTVVTLRRRGNKLSEIAKQVGISNSSVKNILRRHRKRGDSGLLTDYANCGQGGIRSEQLVFRQFCALRRWHPSWGYDKIFSMIGAKYPVAKLPTRRTVYRWWRSLGLVVPKSKAPANEKCWASAAHQVWQIDAKEMIPIKTGQRHCWLNIVDEFTGTVIDPPVFPPGEDLSSGG